MSQEEKEELLSNVKYYWQYRGRIGGFSGYSIEKLKEADPVLADAVERHEIATQMIDRLLEL